MSDQQRAGDGNTPSGKSAEAFFASPEPEPISPRGSSSASGDKAATSATGETAAAGESAADDEASATGEKALGTKAAGTKAAGEEATAPDAASIEEQLTGRKPSARPTAPPSAPANTEEGGKAESASAEKSAARAQSDGGSRARRALLGSGAAAAGSGDGRSGGASAATATAVATATGPGGDSPDADADLSGRPKKPLLAGAAMAGAILVAVPLLVMATGKDDDDSKKVATSNSADTVLDDDGGRAGEFVAESPSPKKSKAEKKEKDKESKSPSPAKERAAVTSPPSPTATATEKEKKRTSVGKKTPSNLPSVMTRVLIKNNTNGTCVDVPGFTSGNPDGPIHQSACNSNTDDNQLWNVEKRYDSKGPGGAPLFQIRNVMDGMCLDLPGYGAAGNATKVTEFPCNGTTADNQLWWLDKQSDGRFWIRNFASNNTCLDSYGPDDQTRDLIVWPCAPEKLNNHEWYFTRS
ncbi:MULTISPECIES: RICIN domain-containing protein [unclassified Streptomyces]|uniref:RICIN domain-containing protein n=1 Tax=unclassified Streptomyces TaxID=2593676 RepID=UPI003369C52E